MIREGERHQASTAGPTDLQERHSCGDLAVRSGLNNDERPVPVRSSQDLRPGRMMEGCRAGLALQEAQPLRIVVSPDFKRRGSKSSTLYQHRRSQWNGQYAPKRNNLGRQTKMG
jgi:hypothetical protein